MSGYFVAWYFVYMPIWMLISEDKIALALAKGER